MVTGTSSDGVSGGVSVSTSIRPVRLDAAEIFRNDTRRMSLPAIPAQFKFHSDKFCDQLFAVTDGTVCGVNSVIGIFQTLLPG